jgi:hypothetical protein
MTPPSASAAAPAISPRRTVGPRRAPSAPRRPRRVSGPANPARNPTRSQTRRLAGRAGPVHAIGLAEAVASHRLLDRLIRGQLWIGVIAFALIGIVTMQLGLLKLNAGIGRSLAHEALLQRENATLSTENSEMAAGERVEAQAEHAGMELIPSGALSFLSANSSTDARKAAGALSVPVSTSTSAAASSESTGSETETSPDSASESTASEATSAAEGSETETASSESSEPAAATSEATGESTSAEATTSAGATAESTESGASTETAAGGAGEATSPSESTSTGGGTTGG